MRVAARTQGPRSDNDSPPPCYDIKLCPLDLADAVAFGLRFDGHKRVHNADEHIAAIAAERSSAI